MRCDLSFLPPAPLPQQPCRPLSLPTHIPVRAYAGAIALSVLTFPFKLAATAFSLPKIWVQVAFRIVLGAANVASFALLKSAAAEAFGNHTATCFALLTASQFHLPFYMSRPLPNSLALVVTTAGLAAWLRGGRPYRAIGLLTFAAVVFRCDAILLAGLVGLHLLATRQVSFLAGMCAGAAAAVTGLALSVGVDSFFWQRWLWPEGEVLWFNTALNK